MSEFSRKFLNEDWKALPDAPRFYLSGFGKHPGWNDHLDEIGLITDSLIQAKDIIYDGIAHQVESAAWAKNGPEKIAAGFDHIIHWRRLNESLTGLMWSSADGKGRSLYPMITLAHCVGQSFDWQAEQVMPALAEVGVKCRATTSSSSVVAILNATQETMRAHLKAEAISSAGSMIGVKEWAVFYTREPDGLRRILHHLFVNFASFAPGNTRWTEGKKAAQSRSIRLPIIPGVSQAEALNAWMSFLATQLDPAVPLLGLLPADGKWLDVIAGEPGQADFVVLRTLPTMTPLASDIPYQLATERTIYEKQIFADLERGQLPGISCFNGTTVEANQLSAAKSLSKSRLNFFSRILSKSHSPFQ